MSAAGDRRPAQLLVGRDRGTPREVFSGHCRQLLRPLKVCGLSQSPQALEFQNGLPLCGGPFSASVGVDGPPSSVGTVAVPAVALDAALPLERGKPALNRPREIASLLGDLFARHREGSLTVASTSESLHRRRAIRSPRGWQTGIRGSSRRAAPRDRIPARPGQSLGAPCTAIVLEQRGRVQQSGS